VRLRLLRSGDHPEGGERGGQGQRAGCVPVRLRVWQRGRMSLWLHRRGMFLRMQLIDVDVDVCDAASRACR